jgi:hypothetical protein
LFIGIIRVIPIGIIQVIPIESGSMPALVRVCAVFDEIASLARLSQPLAAHPDGAPACLPTDLLRKPARPLSAMDGDK